MYSAFEVVDIDTTPAPSRFMRKNCAYISYSLSQFSKKTIYSNHLTYQYICSSIRRSITIYEHLTMNGSRIQFNIQNSGEYKRPSSRYILVYCSTSIEY